jgi:hypothetical protein
LIQPAEPHLGVHAALVVGDGDVAGLAGGRVHRGVARQVEFERQTLKPVFALDRL